MGTDIVDKPRFIFMNQQQQMMSCQSKDPAVVRIEISNFFQRVILHYHTGVTGEIFILYFTP